MIKLENVYIIESKEEWTTFADGLAAGPKRYPAIGWRHQATSPGSYNTIGFENIPNTIREASSNSGYLDVWCKGYDKAVGRFLL